MKAQRAHFDEIGCAYDSSIADHIVEHLIRRRIALARSLVDSGRVLDVGCGTGRFLSALPAGYDGTGLDVSSAMLALARSRGVDVVEGEAEELPFGNDSFDLVTSFAMLHHLIEPSRVTLALSEMARVVRTGGAIMVWDHNPLNPYWRVLMAKLPQDQGDERLVPARLLVDTLRASSLRTVTLRRMTFLPEFTPIWALPAVTRLESVLERVPLIRRIAGHNVVIARA